MTESTIPPAKRPRTEGASPPDAEEISKQLSQLDAPALRRIVQAAAMAYPAVTETIASEVTAHQEAKAAEEAIRLSRVCHFSEHSDTVYELMNVKYRHLSSRNQFGVASEVSGQIDTIFSKITKKTQKFPSYGTKKNAADEMINILNIIVEARRTELARSVLHDLPQLADSFLSMVETFDSVELEKLNQENGGKWPNRLRALSNTTSDYCDAESLDTLYRLVTSTTEDDSAESE